MVLDTLIQERRDDRLAGRTRQDEEALLSELLRRNGREKNIQTATPSGYRYEREASRPSFPVDARGPIMQIAAHPGDGPDFFYATALKAATSAQYRESYHEVLLTDGEGGVDGWHPERTRQVRSQEAYAGAELVGSRLHFLSHPDGKLSALASRERTQLIRQLVQKISQIQPAIVVTHPPKNDHPDHAQSFLLTIAALRLYSQMGGRAPTLLIHDVEFGLQQKSLCVLPSPDLRIESYPMHVPGFIVDVSSTHQTAQRALQEHQTQMYDPVLRQAKLYADLIDRLAQLRGMQCEELARPSQGQGFSHLVIPGVTSEYNFLLQRLPVGSVYQCVKAASL